MVYLANLAGMALPKLEPVEQRKIERQHSLIDVVLKVSEWFASQLKLSSNIAAYEYLLKRGINDQDIKTFSIGYAPSKGLLEFSKKQNISIDLLLEAGLVIQSESKRNEYIERFRNRVIFPIKNQKNQIVGFGGRALDAEVMPKYLNSPETSLFKKSNLLYAAEIARAYAFKTERLIVVEGYIDTIFMHKAGFQETVAALGTAFNSIHLQNLWRLSNEPILCFDGDAAGKKAMLKAAHVALPLLAPGFSLKFCFLPKGKDPDEVINLYGAGYIKELLDNSVTLSDFLFSSELDQAKLNTPESKALFEHKIYELVEEIKNQALRSHYKQYMKNRLWQVFNPPIPKDNKIAKANISIKQSALTVPINLSSKERLEFSLFAQILTYPDILDDNLIYDYFSHLEISNLELEKMQSVLINCHENEKNKLNDLLIENNLSKMADFLSGSRSSFIDLISKIDIITAKKIWNLTYKKYLLEMLKFEYAQFMKQSHSKASAFDKAEELKKSIDLLSKEIIEKENELSPEHL